MSWPALKRGVAGPDAFGLGKAATHAPNVFESGYDNLALQRQDLSLCQRVRTISTARCHAAAGCLWRITVIFTRVFSFSVGWDTLEPYQLKET